MSDLAEVPSITWVDFQKVVESGRVSELASCEILLPEHEFTAIIFHGDVFSKGSTRTKAEYLASNSNINGGVKPQELLAQIEKEKQCLSTNSVVMPAVVILKRQGSTRKSRKSGARRVKAKSGVSTRRSVTASAGGMTPTPI